MSLPKSSPTDSRSLDEPRPEAVLSTRDSTTAEAQEAPQSQQQQRPAGPPGAGGPPTLSPEDQPKGIVFALIIVAVLSSLFLVALDRTILATAIPVITNEFNALDDVTWYAGAYLITSAATQLLWGRIYQFYNTKYVTLVAIFIFELGSVVCGAAPNSVALIIGRAIAGTGSAALFSGTTVIIITIIPLAKRPTYMALLGTVFGVASVIGPLLGGAFTDRVSWRWCFYINLPVGGAASALMLFCLKMPAIPKKTPLKQQVQRLDPPGTLVFLPSIICLMLALQWGGVDYAWNSGRIIALLVLFAVLMAAFWVIQVFQKDNATVPIRIVEQRAVTASLLYSFCIGGALVTMIYWIAIWFQAVKGVSAIRSGINTLPLVLSLTVANLTTGPLVRKTGYYQPPMYFCCVFMPIGAGLMTTFSADTSTSKWIGYQIIFGLGLGAGMQQASLATQNTLSRADVSVGISLMFFGQSLGGAVFNAIAQAVFNQQLLSGLRGVPGINADSILNTGATDVRNIVRPEDLGRVTAAYNLALRQTFYVALGASAFLIVPTLLVPWKKLQGPPGGGKGPGGPPAGASGGSTVPAQGIAESSLDAGKEKA